MTDTVSRRDLLKAAGVAGVAGAGGAAAVVACDEAGFPICRGSAALAAPAPAHGGATAATVPLFFNDPEMRFVEAAVERLIPADATWPGAAEAGVAFYIDRQLASAYGAGARMYLAGPWNADAPPQQGYQLRHTPAELYRIGIAETRAAVQQQHRREFWDLGPAIMDEVLHGLETGRLALPSVPSPVFFETLLANTIEGWFGDPAYGGNRDMVSWRMIGFPGAYAQYLELVDVHGLEFTRPPIAIADHVARHAHIDAAGR